MTTPGKNTPKTRRLLSLIACAFAGTSLVAVAMSTVVWAPGRGVSPSQADILDLVTVSDAPNASFEQALKHLGHEAPRAFDINGNTVYFSVNYLPKTPTEVLKRYQDEFVYQKLNTRTYITAEAADTRQAREDMLTGGIVPLQIAPNYVSMGGGLTENLAKTPADLMRLAEQDAAGKIDKKFRGYRHIEAFQDERARYTTVVASWSDDKFDYRKMLAGSSVPGQSTDPSVPACPGCTRLQRFADLDPDRAHVEHIFVGPAAPEKTVTFYDRALRARGWHPAPGTAVLREARRMNLDIPGAESRQYLQGERTLNLLVYVDTNQETMAHLTLSDG